MVYIKQQVVTASITVCIMERHQAEQVETLVKMNSLDRDHPPRGSPADRRGCFKCLVVLATVMGLVIAALVTAFFLHFFMFMPSCNQDAPLPSNTGKVNVTCRLTRSEEKGRHDIHTVDKAASYLIYGWVMFSEEAIPEAFLKVTSEYGSRRIPMQKMSKGGVYFFDKVSLLKGNKISIYFDSNYTDSLFHVYES